MGDKPVDGRKSEPSLELPSLFRRRNKDRRARPPAPEEPADAAAYSGSRQRLEEWEPAPDGPAAASAAPRFDEPSAGRDPEPTHVETEPAHVDTEPAHVEAERTGVPTPEPAEATQTAQRPAGGVRRAERRARQRRSRPTAPPTLAALVTGVLVGLFGALLTYGSLLGCDAVRGTKSCGGPGLLLLLVIVVLMVVVGALLLRLFKVSEPRGTSFLAVGLTAVVVLVTLMEELFSTWMFIAVPLISAAAFLVAQWVTTRYVELPERGPEHDVR